MTQSNYLESLVPWKPMTPHEAVIGPGGSGPIAWPQGIDHDLVKSQPRVNLGRSRFSTDPFGFVDGGFGGNFR
ncbi:uncharacterized protein N7496_011723 [Penicillium cataractarum]|uniref:Uncharacterized protein n=1 Tax=Penicillium cataractarum TaxID=2100454 RepID=A0A9W9RGW3_9EURO|nr:uncharacterized protein N7496_011723 [Penicillium cataractarum]KAJ5359310.1 hypothetical protein N7496_011723 [Penicillium cataractarum]